MLYRFVNRNDWEKWISIDVPTDVHFLAESKEPPQALFSEAKAASIRSSYERLMFHQQDWRHGYDDGTEIIYVEDGHGIDDKRVFDPRYPSLWREQKLRKALAQIEAVLLESSPDSGLGELLHAHARMDRLADIIYAVPDSIMGRDKSRCWIHKDCRTDASLGRACRKDRREWDQWRGL